MAIRHAPHAGADEDKDVDIERQDGGLLAPPEHKSPSPQTPAQPLAFLDGLRGLAAFIVYMHHHTSWLLQANNDLQHGFGWHGSAHYLATLPFVRVFWTGGSPAVSIFFVLSGYVLSRSPLRSATMREAQPPYRYLVSATVRRPFRLFGPPAAISLAFALAMHTPLAPLLAWPPVHANVFVELWNCCVELAKALNPFATHGPYSAWFPYDPPVWTMAYEFKGSLLVFGVLAATSRLKPRLVVVSCALTGVALLLLGQWAMACFMGGMVLAANDVYGFDESMFKRLTERNRAIVYWIMFMAGWYLCSQPDGVRDPEHSYGTFGWYWLTMMTPGVYYHGEYQRFWNSIAAMLVVYAVLRLRWLQTRLTALKYLGKVSFSFYLVHIPLLWTVGDRIYRVFGVVRPVAEGANGESVFDNLMPVPDFGPRGLSSRFVVVQLFILPLTMAVAHYATIYVDEPSVRFSRWVAARFGADAGKS